MAEQEREVRAAILQEAVHRIEKDLEDFETKLNDYVLKIIFEAHKEQLDNRIKPLERLLYGLVGLVLISVVTAIIATVVR